MSESISKLQAHTETSEDEIGKMIILISDGGMLDELDDPLNENLLTEAKNADIKIYTVGVGAEVDEEILHKIAEATGGEYYYASTNEEISNLSTKIGAARAKDIDMTDSDEDGLPDVFEIAGMQVQEGGIVYTAWDNPDTDGDGLLDGEEIVMHNNWSTGTVTFTMVSDPNLVDTDGDGLSDNQDSDPLFPNSQINEENTQQLLDVFDEYLNEIMPPIYDENGNIITAENAECEITWKYFNDKLWPMLLDSGKAQLGQEYAAYTSWRRQTYGTTGIEEIWVTSNNYISYYLDALCNELADSEISSKILNQVFLGNYSEDITISGTTGQIILGFSGIDFIADIRDVTYDVSHWEWSWSHAGQTGLDLIGIIPIIGSLKNCNEFSELSKLSKVDASTEIEKSVSRIDELIKSGKSEFAIKDSKEFTDLITQNAREVFVNKTSQLDTADVVINKQQWLEGEILSTIFKERWFAFIKTSECDENVYFDKRSYKGPERNLVPGKKVRFLLDSKKENNEILYFATKVEIL